MLTSRQWLIVVAVVVILTATVMLLRTESPVPSEALPASTQPPDPTPASGETPTPTVEDAPQPSPLVSPDPQDDATTDHGVFRTDSSGGLVLDERTRLNIESLIAQNDANELDAAIREHTETLPPGAARSAEELVDKFVQYQQAQRLAYPPSEAPPTLEDAIRQLEGLHALREAHFGVAIAQKLYGAEETIAREMIEIMRIENDQSLTDQEKKERAQALRDRLPAVSAIEKSNRESAASKVSAKEK